MLIFVQCVRKGKTMTKNKQTKKSVKAKTKKKENLEQDQAAKYLRFLLVSKR